MELKDYYSLREIILGLRDEYLKHNEKIEELKGLCSVDWDRVEQFNFSTRQHYNKRRDGELPELHCKYEERLNRVQLLLREVYARFMNEPLIKEKRGSLVSEDGVYRINSWYDDFPIEINGEKNNEEFYEIANTILKSEFANNIDMYSWYNSYVANEKGILLPNNIPGKFQDCSITMYSSLLKISMQMSESQLKTFWLNYSPSADSLELTMFGKDGKFIIDDSVISNVLDVELPATRLNKYHIETIEASNKTDKDIFIDCPDTKKKVNLDIKEDSEQFVLRKSRKK